MALSHMRSARDLVVADARRVNAPGVTTTARQRPLALSHGYIEVGMTDTPEGKRSRAGAYARVTTLLGSLRKEGLIGWGMVLDLTRELDEWRTSGLFLARAPRQRN